MMTLGVVVVLVADDDDDERRKHKVQGLVRPMTKRTTKTSTTKANEYVEREEVSSISVRQTDRLEVDEMYICCILSRSNGTRLRLPSKSLCPSRETIFGQRMSIGKEI